MTTTLQRLQEWYGKHCERVPWEGPGLDPSVPWEELYGVTIDTLDNPGWSVEIDLADTELESEPFERYVDQEAAEAEWLECWRDLRESHPTLPNGPVFRATCGPHRLDEALENFLDWAEGAAPDR